MRRRNDAPYSAFLRLAPDVSICCSSPERFLKVDTSGDVESRPIKGTRKRGKTPEEDEKLKSALKMSEKERAENLMIVDLVRHDLGRVSQAGSVCVPSLMKIESYKSVHQMVSTVRAKLEPGLTGAECLRAAFPMGSMTGAPKLRTMQIIDRIEHSARGIYSGCVGFLALNGAVDTNVVIRSAVVTKTGVEIGAGGAITAKSDPDEEFEEMLIKARALMEAVALTLTNKPDYRISGL